ncbi:shikimate kinase [Tenacibaculum amylolyticum]|uniref:shikimate kinase n=1 Tax=Tenacibaculum amylolyticum TaxID=104269 RepID=UPI003894EF57
MKIILLGYMASGKSTIGKELASKLNLKFIDLDDYIETQLGKTVPVIFETEGEIFFRLKEHEYLKKLLESDESFILSLGGGTPCYANNMNLINSFTNNVSSFYIKVSITTICERLYKEKEQRPLVAKISNEELPEFIAKHLFERSYFYEQASIKIKADDKSSEEIVNEIKSLL